MSIELKETKTSYRPGEAVEGEACWTCDPAPAALVVRLCWRTDAQGSTSDRVTAVEQRIENPAAGQVHQAFSLKAPDAPWSFAGTLFSIRWFVSLVDNDGNYHGETEVVVSPTAKPLQAPAPDPSRE